MKNINNSTSLSRLDLNLFRVFSVIYRERNLTRAADQLNISQSAVSHALSRMRQQLNDPLFVRESQGVAPTPLALRVWPDIQDGLACLQRVIAHRESFDPVRDIKNITLAMNDEVEPVLLPYIVQTQGEMLPEISLSSARIDRSTLKADLVAGRLDCAIDVAQPPDDDLHHALIMRDEFVVISRSSAPIAMEHYLRARHITVSSRRTGRSVEDWGLSRLGIARTVATRCQHYESAWRLVSRSDQLLTMPRSLALNLSSYLGNELHPMPVALHPVTLHLYWHRERDNEPAHRWLRNTLLKTAFCVLTEELKDVR